MQYIIWFKALNKKKKKVEVTDTIRKIVILFLFFYLK